MSGNNQRIFLYGTSWLLNTPDGWMGLSRDRAIAMIGKKEVKATEILQRQLGKQSLLEIHYPSSCLKIDAIALTKT